MTPCNGARFRLPSGDGVGVFDKWSGQEAPVSRSFPLGARAVMASSGGGRFVRAADGQACVEFLAPDFIEAMVTEVGRVIPAGGRHAALTGGEASRGGKDHSTRAGVSWAARIKAQELFRCPTA
jgi:hypothetical protein